MIRRTQKEDTSKIFNLLKETWVKTYVPFGIDKEGILRMFKDKKTWEKNFQSFLHHEDSVTFVAIEDGVLAGVIFGRKNVPLLVATTRALLRARIQAPIKTLILELKRVLTLLFL